MIQPFALSSGHWQQHKLCVVIFYCKFEINFHTKCMLVQQYNNSTYIFFLCAHASVFNLHIIKWVLYKCSDTRPWFFVVRSYCDIMTMKCLFCYFKAFCLEKRRSSYWSWKLECIIFNVLLFNSYNKQIKLILLLWFLVAHKINLLNKP